MKLDDDSLAKLARYCASSYCKQYNCWDQYDDAIGESCLFLLALKEKGCWQTLAPPQLAHRTKFQLVRWYQNENKTRCKHRLKRAPFEEQIAVVDERLDEIDRRDEDMSVIRRAATNAGCLDCLDLVVDVVYGMTIEATARKYNVNSRMFRNVYSKFRFELQKIASGNSGVEIVDGADLTEEEIESCPLLMFV